MTSPSTINTERTNFSARLTSALASERGLAASPTALAREFNQFFDGKAVTVHAARKWLLGEAIPTQDKLQALATWLKVSVDWLRFGSDASDSGAGTGGMAPGPGTHANLDALLKQYMALNLRDRVMARQFITMLVRQHRTAQPAAVSAAEKLTLS